VQIGAARRFANRVQLQPPQIRLQVVYRFVIGPRLPKPLGQSWRGGLKLDQTIHAQNVLRMA